MIILLPLAVGMVILQFSVALAGRIQPVIKIIADIGLCAARQKKGSIMVNLKRLRFLEEFADKIHLPNMMPFTASIPIWRDMGLG